MTDQPITPQKRTPEADAETRETVVESLEFSPSAFQDMLNRMSGSAAAGTMPKSMRYRELTLTIPVEACRLDTFTEPFKLTLRELSAEAELRAYRAMGMQSREGGVGAINSPETEESDDEEVPSAQGQGMLMAWVFGREALHAVNGTPFLDNYQKRLFWNALTMAGRLTVGQLFLAAGAGMDEDLMGKIEESVVVS
jgi:hypothetical protein